jgi:uncharacterized membrane protein YgcG
MKNVAFSFRTIGALALLAVLVSVGQAQNREKFGISAKAGGVNAVTGHVTVTRTGQSAQLLSSQDDLVSGDVVTTGAGSQAEVLLNPGSYLRVAENSEFVLVDNSLNNLVVKLVKGSAIIEATGGNDVDLRINVLANEQHLMIIRGGIYRFNVQPGMAELLVRKGRVLSARNPRDPVKGGTKVTFAAGGPLTAKLTKQDRDEFDLWSKQRAETLARANEKISGRVFNGYLASLSPFERAFSAANPWGLWTFSPFSHCFTFMPFRYGWSSPYGHYYGNYYNVWGYNGFPGYGTNSVIVRNPGSSGGSSGSSSGGSSSGAGGTIGSPTVGPSAPSSSMGSPTGPRDPQSGERPITRVRNPR